MANVTISIKVSNSTIKYDKIYELFGLITIPIGAIGFFGGLVCIWMILKNNNQQKSPANFLFLNLCLCTLFFCGFVCPLHAYAQIVQTANYLAKKEGTHLCQFVAFAYFWTLTASGYAHCAIALNRLFAVVLSGSVRAFFQSKWVTGIMIIMSWVIAGMTFAPPLFRAGGSYGFSDESMKCTFTSLTSPAFVVAYKVVYALVPFVVMIVCYTGVFLKVTLSSRRIRRQQKKVEDIKEGKSPADRAKQRRAMKGEIRVTKIAFMTCFSFLCCYIPSAVFGFGRSRQELQSPLGISLVCLWWVGCAMNPILYAYLNSVLKQRILAWLSQQALVKRIFPASQSAVSDNTGSASISKRQGQPGHSGRKSMEIPDS